MKTIFRRPDQKEKTKLDQAVAELKKQETKRFLKRIRQLSEPTQGFRNGFEKEYQMICRSVEGAPGYLEALTKITPAIAIKNRYTDVLPFEKNRVKIPLEKGNASGDYINASMIDGGLPNMEKTYIACCAPNPAAVPDYWSMIWHLNINVILMLTKFVEKNRVKADYYWDQTKEVQFGPFSVKLRAEIKAPLGYIVRTLEVKKGYTSRIINHIQLTTWPDHGVLTDFTVIRPMLDLMHQLREKKGSPVIVHCSAGIGRSGTFIAIDIILRRLQYFYEMQNSATGAVSSHESSFQFALNIKDIVQSLRMQRPGMVQTLDQYMMIYEYIATILLEE